MIVRYRMDETVSVRGWGYAESLALFYRIRSWSQKSGAVRLHLPVYHTICLMIEEHEFDV